jgi:hypothetical protein
MTLWLNAAQHIEEKIFLTDEEVKKCELLLIFAREKFEFALRSITGPRARPSPAPLACSRSPVPLPIHAWVGGMEE